MFPKALNAIGHMYYLGEGTEKDVFKGLDYTLQSAGFLHTYSLSNMGYMIDELGLEEDSNYWYRLASKNYTMPSSSNETLYERLINREKSIALDDLTEKNNIPKALVEDILFKFYSGTLYEYLEESSSVYKGFNPDDLNMDEDTRSQVNHQRWYDSNYLVDIDSDGSEELLLFRLDGTIGTSFFQVLENKEGEFVIDDNKSFYRLQHGINGLITYDDEKYFVVVTIDIGNRSISDVGIYSFDNGMLADSVFIDVVGEGIKVLKSYQLSNEYDVLVESSEEDLKTIEKVLSFNDLVIPIG